jgi:hypothetical protein
MALWGISSVSETAANNYAIPKFQLETDRNTSPWNTFADVRGWIQRRYKTTTNSGISTRYFDEVLVPVVGLNSTSAVGGTTGIGTAGPVAVFFEDPNLASPISIGAGGTTGISTNTTGYVHVVFNELVFAVLVQQLEFALLMQTMRMNQQQSLELQYQILAPNMLGQDQQLLTVLQMYTQISTVRLQIE